MPIIQQTPEDLKQCRIYKHLLSTSTPADGCSEKVDTFVKNVSPLCDLIISGPFKEYTLHDRNHSKRLIYLAEYIVSPETISQLSPLECLFIIYSAFLHDLGMSVSSDERKTLLNKIEFIDGFREWSSLWETYQQLRKRLNELQAAGFKSKSNETEILSLETEIFQLQEAAISAYLRPRHAMRETYKRIISKIKKISNRPDLFELNGVSFEDWLIEINVSHNLDVGILADMVSPYDERFPRELPISGQRLNTQFISAILRLTDILDFDRERTPRILFESLGIASRSLPGSEVTLNEWQKHMAIHDTEINDEEIIISAECNHPVIEKTIRDFCRTLEREIRDTLAVLRHNNRRISEKYQFILPVSVRTRIKSNNYIYKDISFELNQTAISSLLMGDRLYSNKAAAIRELIQNAIDACSARVRILRDTKYKPEISVTHYEDKSHVHWIEVKDNGIGMDDHVISEYFLKIGNSYYSSHEFERFYWKLVGAERFNPVAKFGIGLASVFMIADAIEAQTRCICSERQDTTSQLVRIERMGGLAFIAEIPDTEYGTSVRIRLRPEIGVIFDDFIKTSLVYIKDSVARPAFDILVKLTDESFIIKSGDTISLLPSAREYLNVEHLEAIVVDFQKWTDVLSGTAILLFCVNGEGKLSHLRDGRRLLLNTTGRYGNIDPFKLVEGYKGNRLSVNGFKMSIKKQTYMLKIARDGIASISDIEVVGDKAVEYNVSREKVIGYSVPYLKMTIRKAVYKCLKETKIFDRFTDQTKEFVEKLAGVVEELKDLPISYFYDYQLTPQIIDNVSKILPQEKWPVYIHKEIAKQLNISNGLAWRAIDALLKSGTIKKPE